MTFKGLPEYKEMAEAPDIAYTKTDLPNFHGAHIQRLNWLIFLKGEFTPVSIELNGRAKDVFLEVCGKQL